jgi:carbon-monoxide dehydrogenase medium subunit
MRRRLNSASIVTVAAVLGAEPRLALGGAGREPIRSASAEAVLAAGPLDRERAEAAGRAALDDAEPFTDAYASAWYRARVLPVHVRRALVGE